MSAYLERLGFCKTTGTGEADGYRLTLRLGNPETFSPGNLAIGPEYNSELFPLQEYMLLVRTGHSGESLMPVNGYNELTFEGLLKTHGDSARAVVYRGELYIRKQ